MPLYEYQCQQCRRLVEKIQKFSDAPLTTCPHCGGTLERTLTAPAVQFKGSGWYKDLYSSAKPSSPAAGGEGASASTEKAASGDGKAASGSQPAGSAGAGAGSSAAPSSSPSGSTPASSGS